jgi:pimeloyl-ACP methyl ester carboxylesterase
LKGEDQNIHVYFVPGMAASTDIFENIRLPEDEFEMHLLKWEMPLKNESLKDYAKRMSQEIKHENPVLIGVSLGGMVVQEMARFLNPRKLIIISSVKIWKEFPLRMKFARKTGIYRLFPTSLIKHFGPMSKLPLGRAIKKRLKLYQRYLGVDDKKYLDWAFRELLNWKRTVPELGLIHIHGERDFILPIKNIKGCIPVPKGTHIMIINRYRWFNRNLPAIIKGTSNLPCRQAGNE